MSFAVCASLFFCLLSAVSAQTPRRSEAATAQSEATTALPPSVVYSVRDPDAIVQYRINPPVVRAMVDRLVLAVTGQPTVAKAWSTLVSPADKVGIKISATGGELFTTHREIVNTIADGLAAAGVPRSSIIVWDRQLGGIKEAGYRAGAEGYQLRSIEPRTGYDEKAVFSTALIGKLIWGDLLYIPHKGANPMLSETENTSNISHFARIVSSEVTKVINVPVLSDSSANGLAGCLYNMTLPNLDNWRRFSQYGRIGAGGIAEVYNDPAIGKKVVLHLMDGLIASYAGGPDSHPNYAVHEATLLASKDPVAIDALALKRLEQLRVEARLPPIGDLAAHVEIAAGLGLGNADPAHIEVKNLSR